MNISLSFDRLSVNEEVGSDMRKTGKYIVVAVACAAWLAIVAHGAWAGEKAKPATDAEQTVTTPVELSSYLIGPGDIIDISVWKDEALTKSVVVLPDGKISFPLIGELQAAGRTLRQVKEEVEAKIQPYVPEPTVSVEIKQVNSLLVYVIGRVNTPGRFILNTNVNVLQALAIAGGLNPFAKRSKIKILRQEGEKTGIIPFKYDDVVEGTRLEQNMVLKRGDVVVVP
jgi:polysaccharide biosynthesis/export protein